MDNNMMMQFMQMMMQNQTMMNQMMMQLMTQPNPNPIQSAAPALPNQEQVIAQSNAAVSASVQEVADLKAEIKSLKSQLAAVQSELSTTKSELSTTKSQLASSQAQVKTLTEKTSNLSNVGKKMEQVPEGQLTLEDEIKYQERHGAEGHENYKNVMNQLSEEERKKLRDIYYADSDGVFDLEDAAKARGLSVKEIIYLLHPEVKDAPTLVDFTGTPIEQPTRTPVEEPVNEFGF